MEIRFETKEESQARRDREARKRTPNERFVFFLHQNNNFILERRKSLNH